MRIAKLDHYGLLQVAGDDARAFLHAQLTNDVENLPAGRARYAGWCSAKGRLLATLLVVPIQGGFLLQLSRDLAPAVAKRLSMYVLRSKVKVTDVSSQWSQFGAWGPAEGELLSVSGRESAITIHMDDERSLVLAPADTESRFAPTIPEADWMLAEVRAGRPFITQATHDQFVPQMVNLELADGVDFRKGCYPGQEIVARAQYRGAVKRRMVRLRGAALRPGQELFSDDSPGVASGTVVNAAGDEALAVMPVSAIESRSSIRPQPDAAPLEVLSLPYAK